MVILFNKTMQNYPPPPKGERVIYLDDVVTDNG